MKMISWSLQFSQTFVAIARMALRCRLLCNIFLPCCFAANVHAFTSGSYLGHRGGVDGSSAYSSFASYPLTSDGDDTRAEILTRPSQENFRTLITDGGLYSPFMRSLKKPSFFFSDALASDDELL